MHTEALEAAAAALAASLGTQLVSSSCAAALRTILPGAEFLRTSVRCGTGLFISGDLLQPGPLELSVVSLRHSLAGLAMAQRQPVVVTAPAAGTASARQVLCLPVALQPTSSSGSNTGQPSSSSSNRGQPASAGSSCAIDPPLCVGALMVGAAADAGAQPVPAQLWAGLQALADAAAPYLLVLGLAQAKQMGELLRLRGGDGAACGSEEDEVQDVPHEVCAPPPPPRGGAGGTAGPLPAGFSPSGGEPPAEAAAAAAAAALSRRSRLAGGAAGSPGGSGGSLQQEGAALPTSKQRQDTEGGSGGEEVHGPNAPCKPRQACAARAPPLAAMPRGPLLRFADPAVEARYTATYNSSLACSDTLFAAVHLCAALCVTALHPAALAGSRAAQAFAAALLVPLLAPLLAPASYVRHREAVVAALLAVHAVLLRAASLPTLLRLLPVGTAGKLPWLLRATGAEALAIFPLGFKLRLCLFLPLHTLCVALAGSALPSYCGTWQATGAGCLRSALRTADAALALLLGCALPPLLLYRLEAHSRRRFLEMERRQLA